MMRRKSLVTLAALIAGQVLTVALRDPFRFGFVGDVCDPHQAFAQRERRLNTVRDPRPRFGLHGDPVDDNLNSVSLSAVKLRDLIDAESLTVNADSDAKHEPHTNGGVRYALPVVAKSEHPSLASAGWRIDPDCLPCGGNGELPLVAGMVCDLWAAPDEPTPVTTVLFKGWKAIEGATVGGWRPYRYSGMAWVMTNSACRTIPLPLGVSVGTVTVEAIVPIVDIEADDSNGPYFYIYGEGRRIGYCDDDTEDDTDLREDLARSQAVFSEFVPGRVCLLLKAG